MRATIVRKVLLTAVIAALAGATLSVSPLSNGQEAKKAKGRLPAYYADIVTESQKTQIYGIQERYAKQLAEIQAQLDAVTKQRDAEIEGLLNAEQRDKLKRARDEAAAKKKKAADEKKAADKAK